MQKRIVAILLFILFLLCATITVYAGTSKRHIKEAGITIGIPDGYVILSRDNLDSHSSFLKDLDYSVSSMRQYMIQQSIYLDCIAEDFTKEIVVVAASANMTNFGNLSDDWVLAQVSVFKEQYANSGIDLYRTEVYENDQAKYAICFIKSTYEYGMEYYTIYNGMTISIKFHNYLGSFSTADINKCKKIIDAIQFDNPPINTPMEEMPTFQFADNETGTTFTMPENWKETSFSKPHDGLENMFVSTIDSVVAIMYGSTDIYPKSVAEDPSLKREDIDISDMTAEEIKDMFSNLSSYNPATDSFNSVYYNGTEYIEVKRVEKQMSYGMEVLVHTVALTTTHNGYVYVFAFCESDESPYYDDFIRMMNSVVYAAPIIQPTTETATSAPTQVPMQQTTLPENDSVTDSSSNNGKKLSTGHIMIIGCFSLLLAIIIPAVIINSIKKRKIRKNLGKKDSNETCYEKKGICTTETLPDTVQPESEKKYSGVAVTANNSLVPFAIESDDQVKDTSNLQQSEPVLKPLFCHKCGARLLPGSDFCSYCGQRISE